MKFFLKTKKTEGRSTLFFEVNKRTPKFKAQFNTFVSVDVKQWEKAQESAKSLTKYMSTPEGAKVYSLLQAIENAVNDLFILKRIRGAEDKPLITDAVSSIAFAEERQRIAEEQARKEREELQRSELAKNQYKDIIKFYDKYLSGIQDGTITTGGKEYRAHSVNVWEAFGKHLKPFMNGRPEKTFDEISPIFRDEFVQFLKASGLMKGSVSNYVAKFRALCKAAAKYGYNNNAVSLTGWETGKADKEEKKTAVYLTENELQRLYEMPLKGKRAFVRDMFFVGSIIAQRFSDYSRINKTMFQNVDGVTFLSFSQEKTGKEMVIPITDERVLGIFKKYGYTFPPISLMNFNKQLHTIFEELAKDVPSLCENIPTAPTMKDARTTKQKWELISSHTARRSAVTNMYKSGLLDKREMMAISGHTTEKIFEDYIKLGTFEQAKRIAEKLKASKDVKTTSKVG
jgi:integrase